MMRLIDADEMAVNETEAYIKVQTSGNVSAITQGLNSVVHRKIQQLIADTPTVDAEPVVRCKDCKYWDSDGRCDPRHNGLILDYTAPNDYCSYGERKDGADNG